MLREQWLDLLKRRGWILYTAVALVCLVNCFVLVRALSEGAASGVTIPALVFSAIAGVCAAAVGIVLFRGRPTD
ncbi:hypothetical protein [Marisediminicola sp. LYQ134]|uniref:hypothetical protein n=1 Tax=unclassified Marisediminicola TaxID=2618316 RepID=UPI0039831D97